MWKHHRWLCLDTETTGLDPVRDRIVQIGGVWYENGRLLKTSSALINPGVAIPSRATRIHGITDAMVARSPSVSEVAPGFFNELAGAYVLLGYNWQFDDDFLLEAFGGSWREACANKVVIDVLPLAQHVLRLPSHRLEAVADALQLRTTHALHEATTDALLTCHVLWALARWLPDDVAAIGMLSQQLDADRMRRQSQRWRRHQKAQDKVEKKKAVEAAEPPAPDPESIVQDHERAMEAATQYHHTSPPPYNWSAAAKNSEVAQLVLARSSGALGDAMTHLFPKAAPALPLEFAGAPSDVLVVATLRIKQPYGAVPFQLPRVLRSGEVRWRDMPKTALNVLYQDHVCSWVLRAGRELFAFAATAKHALIHARAKVLNKATGHDQDVVLVSALLEREQFESLTLERVDPSDCVESFHHQMDFSSRRGFRPVEPLSAPDIAMSG